MVFASSAIVGELAARYGGDLLGNAFHAYGLTHDSDVDAEQMAKMLNEIDIPRKSPLPHSVDTQPTNHASDPTPTTPPVKNPSTHRQKAYSFDEPVVQGNVSPAASPPRPIHGRGAVVSGGHYSPACCRLVYFRYC